MFHHAEGGISNFEFCVCPAESTMMKTREPDWKPGWDAELFSTNREVQ